MEEREDPGEPEGPADQTFTWPLLGALYGSLVLVAIVAVLASNLGRGFEDEVDTPARTLVAAPVVIFAVVVSLASMLALILGIPAAVAADRGNRRLADPGVAGHVRDGDRRGCLRASPRRLRISG